MDQHTIMTLLTPLKDIKSLMYNAQLADMAARQTAPENMEFASREFFIEELQANPDYPANLVPNIRFLAEFQITSSKWTGYATSSTPTTRDTWKAHERCSGRYKTKSTKNRITSTIETGMGSQRLDHLFN